MEIVQIVSQFFHSQAFAWSLGVFTAWSVLKEIEIVYRFSKRDNGW